MVAWRCVAASEVADTVSRGSVQVIAAAVTAVGECREERRGDVAGDWEACLLAGVTGASVPWSTVGRVLFFLGAVGFCRGGGGSSG